MHCCFYATIFMLSFLPSVISFIGRTYPDILITVWFPYHPSWLHFCEVVSRCHCHFWAVLPKHNILSMSWFAHNRMKWLLSHDLNLWQIVSWKLFSNNCWICSTSADISIGMLSVINNTYKHSIIYTFLQSFHLVLFLAKNPK